MGRVGDEAPGIPGPYMTGDPFTLAQDLNGTGSGPDERFFPGILIGNALCLFELCRLVGAGSFISSCRSVSGNALRFFIPVNEKAHLF
jgi:hypothetical protein